MQIILTPPPFAPLNVKYPNNKNQKSIMKL